MKRLIAVLLALVLVPPLTVATLVGCVAARAPVAPTVVAPASEFPMAAAERALRRDDPLLAIGYYSQVTRDDPNYARAQRMIGHEVYSHRLGRPAQGLRHVLRGLRYDPRSENSWTDAGRVILAAVRR